jgi:hypothetical protein
MAYDAATGNVILFGGTGSDGTALGDTWSFDGTNWVELNPASSPSPRWNVSMTYDPATQMIVLFGGYDNGTASGETWNWNGSNWIQQHPGASPAARYGDMIGYNAALGGVALYGGQTSPTAGSLLSDTWKWDGANGGKITSGGTPGARSFAAMDDNGVLFGDDGGAFQVNDCSTVSTWQLTSAGWNDLSADATPPGRSYPVMAYDPNTGNSVMFGGTGCDGTFLGDTWTFAGPQLATTVASLTDSSGHPISGAAVVFRSASGPVTNATTGPDGTAGVTLTPGRYSVTMYYATGYQTKTISVTASSPSTISFTTVAVTAQINDPDSPDLAAASVAHAGNTGTFGPKTPVDGNGQVTFQVLPGTNTFTAWDANGYQSQTVTVTGPATISFSTVAVTVTVLKNGSALATATVGHAGNTGTFGPKTPVDGNGQITFQVLPGTNTFTAWDASAHQSQTLAITTAATTSISVP